MNKKIGIFGFITFILFNCLPWNTVYPMVNKDRILFISSYNSSFPIFFQQIDGIRSILSDENSILDLEFMDSKRFFSEKNVMNFYNLIKFKMENSADKYDAIIVADDNAYNFAMEHEQELFKDTPIVFFGVNDIEKAKQSERNPWVTGVAEVVSIEDTLKAAMEINPNATKVVAISDYTETGIQDVKSFYSEQKNFSNIEFSDIKLGDLSLDNFKAELSSIDNSTIILFVSAFRDLSGTSIDFETVVNFVRDNCSQPIFTLYMHGIGSGLLGGKVVNHIQQGRIAAEMVEKILSGTKVSQVPFVDNSPNSYIFDYEQLKKFDIDENLLPVDSLIINREIPFYEKYKEYIWSISIIFIIMMFFISYLLINIKFRKKAERDLVKSNKSLATLYEELETSSEELQAQFNEIQQQDAVLVHAKESYRLICEASAGGTWDFDLKAKVRKFTDSWYKEYGFSQEDILETKNWARYIHPEDKEIFLSYQRSIKESLEEKYSCEYRIAISSGEYRYFIEKCIVIRDAKGIIERIAGSHSDITDKKLQELEIKKLAYHDILTGLPNRAYLNKEFSSLLRNYNKKALGGCTVFVGLDNFSLINEFFGHETGDKVLIYISNKLKDTFSHCDNVFISKFSGDEYVIIVKDLYDDKEMNEYIKRILGVFEEKVIIEDNELYVTVSMGMVLFPKDGNTVEELFKNADTALHKAKEAGKNCYKFFHHSMNDSIRNKILMQSSIRKALENHEFILHYQPQIDVKTGKLSGYEALVRWISPSLGFVRPDKFIKLSEENGTIVHLGRWVLEQACEFSKKINSNKDDKYVVSVNISPIELMQYEFVDRVKGIINHSGANPRLIEIEITESALMESFDANIKKLNMLKELGVGIALDDFGTGYSSLNYLNQLPIDTLKIDKSFVDDIANSNEHKSFVDIIIVLAHRMGLKVVAEGVETEVQREVLTTQGCDKIQGYIFSKPLTELNAIEYKNNF